jgi:hypothetical protein
MNRAISMLPRQCAVRCDDESKMRCEVDRIVITENSVVILDLLVTSRTPGDIIFLFYLQIRYCSSIAYPHQKVRHKGGGCRERVDGI